MGNAAEVRYMPQERIIRYLPGLLPSGWSKSMQMPVLREHDGAWVMSYSGFGLLVTIVCRGDVEVQVQRPARDRACTNEELSQVTDNLYRRSPLRFRLHTAATDPKTKVTTFKLVG